MSKAEQDCKCPMQNENPFLLFPCIAYYMNNFLSWEVSVVYRGLSVFYLFFNKVDYIRGPMVGGATHLFTKAK